MTGFVLFLLTIFLIYIVREVYKRSHKSLNYEVMDILNHNKEDLNNAIEYHYMDYLHLSPESKSLAVKSIARELYMEIRNEELFAWGVCRRLNREFTIEEVVNALIEYVDKYSEEYGLFYP